MDPEKRKKLDAKLRAMLEYSEQSSEKKQKIVTSRTLAGGVIRRRKGSPEKRF